MITIFLVFLIYCPKYINLIHSYTVSKGSNTYLKVSVIYIMYRIHDINLERLLILININ